MSVKIRPPCIRLGQPTWDAPATSSARHPRSPLRMKCTCRPEGFSAPHAKHCGNSREVVSVLKTEDEYTTFRGVSTQPPSSPRPPQHPAFSSAPSLDWVRPADLVSAMLKGRGPTGLALALAI